MHQTYPVHPLAEAFPLIEGPAFDELVASIRENGLRESVVLFEGAVLDGRNRLRACEAASVEPSFETYTGDNPAAYVIDKNINRRHLNASQRAMIGAKLALFKVGGSAAQRQKMSTEAANTGQPVLTVVQAAELLSVNKETISDARRVLADGTPEEVEQIERGEASVKRVANQIRQGIKPEKRVAHEPKAKRNGTQQIHAEVWQRFKAALVALTDLPRVEDTVPIIRGKDRNGLIAEKLPLASNYLKEFLNAWNSING